MVLETISGASFILASGLFAVLIGYYDTFLNKVKEELKKEENNVVEDFSKAVAEPIVDLIKKNENIQPDLPFLTDFYKKIFDGLFEITKRRDLIREPYIWLDDLKRGICLAILLFLASGTLSFSYYNVYAPPVFIAGVACVVYGVYKFYQITNRTAP